MLWPRTHWMVIASMLVACGTNDPRETCTSAECQPTPSPTPDPKPTESDLALVRVNKWRELAGLGKLTVDAKLTQAAQAHAKFMANTPQSCWPGAHDEVMSSSCPGFTGATTGDRLTAAGYTWGTYLEAIAFGNSDINEAVDSWLWTVYHRLVLMWPATTNGGFDCENMYCVLDVARPRNVNAPSVTQPIVFPAPDMTGVPKGWNGNEERPAPPAPSKGWPAGPVISIYFPGSWSISNATLTKTSAPGTSIPMVQTTAQNDPNLANMSQNDVFLYAESPLEGNTSYTVHVEGSWNNEEWSKTWSFTTTP